MKFNVFQKLIKIIVEKFESEIFMSGIQGSYLNFIVFCFL